MAEKLRMQTVFQLNVTVKGAPRRSRLVQKTADMLFVPPEGLKLECSLWQQPRCVEGITIDLDTPEPTIELFLGRHETNNQQEADELIEKYEHNDWDIVA